MLSLTLKTEIGSLDPGTKARLDVAPVSLLVSKNAKASVYWHWKVPYSSEAKTKLKPMVFASGTKSNWI